MLKGKLFGISINQKMILKYQYRLLIVTFCLFYCPSFLAQSLAFIEVSEKKKNNYQAILDKNKDVVLFIESTLIQNGLPKMMRNLALIESSFDKNAVSSAKAAGIWQFMEEHAAQYGLKSNDRFDVFHSTQTAMKSLKKLYDKYGNWITVVAAYNCGEGNIEKAMNKANSDRYDKFYKYLPDETINHVYKFMEACSVTNELEFLIADYKLSAFKTNETHENKSEPSIQATNFTSVEINASYILSIISEEMKIEHSELISWNPNIVHELDTQGIAKLYLPIDLMPDFLLLKNIILNRSIQSNYDQ